MARKPVGGNQGWENENEPTSAPNTLGIHGGPAVRYTKQATTLPEERNKPSAGSKARALNRVLMGANPIIQNKTGGRNELGGGTVTTASPTAVQQQDAGGRECRMVSSDEGHENVWASSNYTGVLNKTTQIAGRCWGGVDKLRHV